MRRPTIRYEHTAMVGFSFLVDRSVLMHPNMISLHVHKEQNPTSMFGHTVFKGWPGQLFFDFEHTKIKNNSYCSANLGQTDEPKTQNAVCRKQHMQLCRSESSKTRTKTKQAQSLESRVLVVARFGKLAAARKHRSSAALGASKPPTNSHMCFHPAAKSWIPAKLKADLHYRSGGSVCLVVMYIHTCVCVQVRKQTHILYIYPPTLLGVSDT